MRYFASILIAIGFSAGDLSPAVAQQLTMSQVMTPEELRASGVESLTAQQRAALDRWLNRYTAQVIQVVQGRTGGRSTYPAVGGGHWIKEKSRDGEMVILEDGSIWAISSIDRIYTAIWLPITNIAVLDASAPIGEYRYILVNTDDGERALAKYMGKQ